MCVQVWNVMVGSGEPSAKALLNSFFPQVLTIHEGDTVVFTSMVTEPHNVVRLV